jgi:hypothetical protein
MSTSLITTEEVKEQIPIPSAVTEHDSLIGDLIEDCINEAEDFIDAKLNPVTGEEVYLDGGTGILFVPHLNISNVTIWEDDSEVDADDYAVYSSRGKIRKKKSESGFNAWAMSGSAEPGQFMEGELIIKVQYDGGYTTLPRALKRKLIRQVAYEFRRRKDLGLMSVTYPDGTINKFEIGEWLPDVEQVLHRFERFAF